MLGLTVRRVMQAEAPENPLPVLFDGSNRHAELRCGLIERKPADTAKQDLALPRAQSVGAGELEERDLKRLVRCEHCVGEVVQIGIGDRLREDEHRSYSEAERVVRMSGDDGNAGAARENGLDAIWRGRALRSARARSARS